jgi:SAM-dependent methyltransferase
MIDPFPKWSLDYYLAEKQAVFEQIDTYLKTPPKRMLDIGAGYGYIPELFQKKYGTEIFFLEGDFESTSDRERKGKYGEVKDFKFYVGVKELKEYWDSRDIKYTFVDANNISLEDGIKFDLVTSFLSCGYHYPANTYKDLIAKHTDVNSVVIMDIRAKTLKEQSKDFDVIETLNTTSKHQRTHFSFHQG